MRIFGFSKTWQEFTPENALFSLPLQHNAVIMMPFSRSTAVEQLPAATIDTSWQVQLGFWKRASADTYQNCCRPLSQ
jgi:hypothetical protein